MSRQYQHRVWMLACLSMATAIFIGRAGEAQTLFPQAGPHPPSPLLIGAVTPIELANEAIGSGRAETDALRPASPTRVHVMIERTSDEQVDTAPRPPIVSGAIDDSLEAPPLSVPTSGSPDAGEIIEEPGPLPAFPQVEAQDEEVETPAPVPASGSPGYPETVRERYPNGSVKIARQVAMDAEGNYVNHGAWQMWDQGGNLIAEGQYEMGQRDGAWRRWLRGAEAAMLLEPPYDQFKEPFLSQANLRHGQLDGAWTILDSQGRKISEIEFTDGQRNGAAVWWHATGHKMQEVHFEHGMVVGKSRVWDQSGNLKAEERFQEGRKISLHRQRWSNGQLRTEGKVLGAMTVIARPDDWWQTATAKFSFEGKAVKHGPWKTWHSNGQQQSEGQYERGMPVGKFTWWHSNGQKALEGDYQEGHQQRKWIWWHPNGQRRSQGQYESGDPAGVWMWWKTDGTLEKRLDYSQGEQPSLSASPHDRQAAADARQAPLEIGHAVPKIDC